jgi:hypothetical protein
MSEDPEEVEAPVSTSQLNEAQPPKAQKGKGRKFFQHMQPSFAIELPKPPTMVEFLDENDPEKATIVRKKAREWVNQNRDKSKKTRQKQQQPRITVQDERERPSRVKDLKTEREKSQELMMTPSLLRVVGSRKNDPFDSLPDMGIKYEHMMEYCKFTSLSCHRILPITLRSCRVPASTLGTIR